MRKIYILLVFVLTVFACQTEDNSVRQQLDSALTKSAPLSRLMSRVAQNPTHRDNILDGTDCYSVKLPVSVTVNGQNIVVSDEADFNIVAANMQASNGDDDIVHFAFPIVVVFPDFHQIVVNHQSELDAIACDDDDFSEIRCLDFVFPIAINIYNTNNQIANTVTIQDNYQLYHFIKDVSESQIFTVVYPITLSFSDGHTATVAGNNALEDLIEDSIHDCDDDNGGSGPQPVTLDEIISSGVWHISFCEGGGPNNGNYQGYNFTFHPNGTITVQKNGAMSYGTWDSYPDGSHHKIDLNFTDPFLHNLNDDWKVTEFNQTNFRLKKDNSGSGGGHGGQGGNNYVYFTKN